MFTFIINGRCGKLCDLLKNKPLKKFRKNGRQSRRRNDSIGNERFRGGQFSSDTRNSRKLPHLPQSNSKPKRSENGED